MSNKPEINELFEEHDARVATVEWQRNRALSDHAVAQGKLQVTKLKLAAAQEREKAVQAKVAELEADKTALQTKVAELEKKAKRKVKKKVKTLEQPKEVTT